MYCSTGGVKVASIDAGQVEAAIPSTELQYQECPASVDCARVIEFNAPLVYIKKRLTSRSSKCS
jgi:hypothetical protein